MILTGAHRIPCLLLFHERLSPWLQFTTSKNAIECDTEQMNTRCNCENGRPCALVLLQVTKKCNQKRINFNFTCLDASLTSIKITKKLIKTHFSSFRRLHILSYQVATLVITLFSFSELVVRSRV